MKNFGSTVDFTHQRNADILRIYRQKIAEAGHIRMEEICRQIADSPASRFWVSEARAAIVISSMLAGRVLPRMTKSKREMFAEIFRRFKELRLINPKMSIRELASMIVNQPAPKFYYTPRSIGQFISRMRTGFYDRMKQKK